MLGYVDAFGLELCDFGFCKLSSSICLIISYHLFFLLFIFSFLLFSSLFSFLSETLLCMQDLPHIDSERPMSFPLYTFESLLYFCSTFWQIFSTLPSNTSIRILISILFSVSKTSFCAISFFHGPMSSQMSLWRLICFFSLYSLQCPFRLFCHCGSGSVFAGGTCRQVGFSSGRLGRKLAEVLEKL